MKSTIQNVRVTHNLTEGIKMLGWDLSSMIEISEALNDGPDVPKICIYLEDNKARSTDDIGIWVDLTVEQAMGFARSIINQVKYYRSCKKHYKDPYE